MSLLVHQGRFPEIDDIEVQRKKMINLNIVGLRS